MSDIPLKILTYNIHKGFDARNRQFVLHDIRDELHASDVDIVFLQEIIGEQQKHEAKVENWPATTQYEFLADQLWPHFAYGKNAIYSAGHHGNAILSKYPFEHWENINLSSMRRASRSLLHGIIRHPVSDARLHILCVHLDLIGFERRRQLTLVKHHIHDYIPPHEPLVLAGDFNDWNGRLRTGIETDLRLTEAFKSRYGRYAKTYPSNWPVLSMDRIYFRGLSLVDCESYTGKPWKKLSDHSPLYAEFGSEGRAEQADVKRSN